MWMGKENEKNITKELKLRRKRCSKKWQIDRLTKAQLSGLVALATLFHNKLTPHYIAVHRSKLRCVCTCTRTPYWNPKWHDALWSISLVWYSGILIALYFFTGEHGWIRGWSPFRFCLWWWWSGSSSPFSTTSIASGEIWTSGVLTHTLPSQSVAMFLSCDSP